MSLSQDELLEIDAGFNRSLQTILVLQDDVTFVSKVFTTPGELQKYTDEEQYTWYRTLIRTFFACVEGTIFNMKQIADGVGKLIGYSFSVEEKQLMKGQHTINGKKKRLSLKEKVPRSLDLFYRVFDIPMIVDTSTPGWEAFERLIKVRNRFMHPESIKDLHYKQGGNIDDIRDTIDGNKWFFDTTEEAWNQGRGLLVKLKAMNRSN